MLPLLLLIVSALSAQTVLARTFTACVVWPPAGGVHQFGITSGSQCEQVCSSKGFSYAYHSNKYNCVCNRKGPINNDVVSTPSTAPGPNGQCPHSAYSAVKLSTTFQYQACASGIFPSPLDSPSGSANWNEVPNHDACFDQCRKSRYAMLWPGGAGFKTWMCTCLNNPPKVVLNTDWYCENWSRYLFGHSVPEASAGLARRAPKPRITEGAELYCPTGLEPCRVDGGGYECLDVNSELYSCGGCISGSLAPNSTQTLGVDCTTLEGAQAGGVTCNQGKCQIQSCAPGYFSVDGGCRRR